MRRLYSNVNARRHTVLLTPMTSVEGARVFQGKRLMSEADHASVRFASHEAKLAVFEHLRQSKKEMLKVVDASELIRAQKDRRHRPRWVKKKHAKVARKLRLTTRLKRHRKVRLP